MCPSFFRNQPTDVPESKNDQEEPKKDESNKDKTEGEKENEARNDDGTGDEMNDDRTDDEMNDTEVTNDEQQQQQSDNRGKKRSQDSTDGELQDSFHKNFPPLKTRRPSKTPPGISVSNPFSLLDDGDSDSPLVIDESPVESEKSGGAWDSHLGQGT
jgi:hypothetical protein